jgi:hypothetical protein
MRIQPVAEILEHDGFGTGRVECFQAGPFFRLGGADEGERDCREQRTI